MQTECPHCHTLFRVTEAQLDMAEGMVRCGVCKQIFDARADNKPPPDENRPARDAPIADAAIETITEELDAADQIPTYSTAATVAWSLAILFLIATLAAEYIWFNQPELLQGPRFRPITARLCELTDCQHLQKRDLSKIEMISRNIYTHPNAKEALMITTTLVNNAAYAQPYPDVQIDFSNVRGEMVASRRFHPEEYLQKDGDQVGLLQSDNPIAFGLEIRDPGKQAITYEFSFH